MSNNGAGEARSVVPFGAKSNAKSQAGDELDRAGQAILGSLHRAASAAEAKYQQAVEMTHKLSAQLRASEDRIRELENKAQYHEYKADRAENWLYQITLETEQTFFNGAPEPALRK
jgi:hypothetical protein